MIDEMLLEMVVYLLFNHLMWLLARGGLLNSLAMEALGQIFPKCAPQREWKEKINVTRSENCEFVRPRTVYK